ncbi:recombinase RecF [Lysinibacillus sp. BF-4]|uniref:DNA replication/repair protein RecF n=1 Tax=Lysinibacillus sp. BF-4 TaxID=1473546 RepID=UPI0005070466|nr:DNA replication/repair protein RecF [Lysinibacillus sp. BF-4]KFL43682.1 recombinase RecF [Lysinibacillus sp. BF-4]
MYIENIELQHYRNYESLSLTFSPKINVFIGENAQGKTNVMEAIYALAMTKSHRTSNDKELIAWEQEHARIEGTVHRKYGSFPLQLIVTKQGKKTKVNHLLQGKLSDYIGQMNVVMFAPEDLHVVKGSPQFRRRFIDVEIGQISPTYLHELMQFNKILKQRNQFLKDAKYKKLDPILLDVYTEQYVLSAAEIIHRRFLFMTLLQTWAAHIHTSISQGKETLVIKYKTEKEITAESTVAEIAAVLTARLNEMKQREFDRGVTLIGPHRDDLQFFVNDYDVQTYGSQGQQRTTALSLKLAEIELIKQETQEAPILLLDDVLSELDDYRQSHLLNTIKGEVQTFVTTTSVEGIEHATIREAKMFHVERGTVTEDKSLKEE